jgi:hypothetical protein
MIKKTAQKGNLMKNHEPENDLQECLDIIIKLLIEYNCRVIFDSEIHDIIITDLDTNKFLNFTRT